MREKTTRMVGFRHASLITFCKLFYFLNQLNFDLYCTITCSLSICLISTFKLGSVIDIVFFIDQTKISIEKNLSNIRSKPLSNPLIINIFTITGEAPRCVYTHFCKKTI